MSKETSKILKLLPRPKGMLLWIQLLNLEYLHQQLQGYLDTRFQVESGRRIQSPRAILSCSLHTLAQCLQCESQGSW